MKLLIVLSAFCALAHAHMDLPQDVQEKMMNCVMESDIDPMQFQDAFDEGDWETLGCFVGCILEKFDVVDGKGNYNVDVAHKNIDYLATSMGEQYTEEDRKLVEDCLAKVKGETDMCKVGVVIGECVFSEMIDRVSN